MIKYISGLLVITGLITACGGNVKPVKQELPQQNIMAKAAPEETKYDTALVANKKDPFCRMPTRLGVADTAHYKGLVLGFCSTACKDSFLLKPEEYKLVLK